MLYDWRIQPQAIVVDDILYFVYQANEYEKKANPYIIALNLTNEQWSEPVKLGEVSAVNHHYAPILWVDHNKHLHVNYHCHRTAGVHIVSEFPNDHTKWKEAPKIADSITYPSMWRISEKELVLVHRIEGHLGYWVMKHSLDGGFSWSEPLKINDFDYQATNEVEEWAGSYLGILPKNKDEIHIGFIYFDERNNANPVYNTFEHDLFSRYHMYYINANWRTGELKTITGDKLNVPVNLKEAEKCKIIDWGHELTNLPSIAQNEERHPLLISPLSHNSPWTCTYKSYFWNGVKWDINSICETDNIWSSSLPIHVKDNHYKAWLIVGKGKDEKCYYGGGELQLWETHDNGAHWQFVEKLEPESGLIYNNPKMVFNYDGSVKKDFLLFFGWEGPESMWKKDIDKPNSGKAFLYNGKKFIA